MLSLVYAAFPFFVICNLNPADKEHLINTVTVMSSMHRFTPLTEEYQLHCSQHTHREDI